MCRVGSGARGRAARGGSGFSPAHPSGVEGPDGERRGRLARNWGTTAGSRHPVGIELQPFYQGFQGWTGPGTQATRTCTGRRRLCGAND